MADRCTCCQRLYADPRVLCKECEKYEAMMENLRVRHEDHHEEMLELWAIYAQHGTPEMTVEDVPRGRDAWRKLKRFKRRSS